MLILLSPAKTITGVSAIEAPMGSQPEFRQEASDIAMQMAQYTVDELKSLLKLNPQLAVESYMRFQHFHSTESSALQALLAYTGIVFKRIQPVDFSAADFQFAQEHLRIVSICYGLLRPLDLIKPYRMEYSVKLPEFGEGNMYAYWNKRHTKSLIDTVIADGGLLLNLASKDVQPAFDWQKVKRSVRVLTPEFKVWKNGKYQTVVIYAKMARGEMSRFIIKHQITDPEKLKDFSWEGFCYNERLSEEDNWVFTQE